MRPSRFCHGIGALFAALPTLVVAQTAPAPSILVARLEARVPALLDSAGIPGLSIAVLENGQLTWSGAFGARNTTGNERVTGGTIFEAASLTKPLFAYGVLELVDRGVIDLDRPLSEYLPLSEFSDDPRIEVITARMVLTHTSGISGFAEDGRLTFGADPGARFRYFGDAWLPLQRVVEKLTGEPAGAFLRREVFDPLGMEKSSLVWETRFEGDYATPHDELGRPLEKRRFEEAHVAATLHTTAMEYARFLAAAMNGEGLRPGTASDFLSPQVEVAPGVTWGLGVGLQEDSRGHAFWQWGHWQGTRAFMIAYPAIGDGLVYLANGDAGLAILDAVLGIAFGLDQPGADWQGYEQFDEPTRLVRLELRRIFEGEGTESGMTRLIELESIAPAEALTEASMNRLGYDLLREERGDAAIAVFRRNVERFPESSNVYDSLGEAYLADDQLGPALENYRRSLALDPANANANAERVIEQILERMARGS